MKSFLSLLMHGEHQMTKMKAKHVRRTIPCIFVWSILNTQQQEGNWQPATGTNAEMYEI